MTKLHIPYLPIIIVLASMLSLIGIIGHDVQEWDEARNGVNAYEMYHNKDYINLYYDGAIDTWNAKPPLLTWLVVLSYHIFGFNEYGLRLPSLLATILFFTYLYLLIRLYDTGKTAFLSCFILLCCKAVVGPRVGITGDFDALLLLFLTAMVYHFMRYLHFGATWHIYVAAIFFGLAFYTKGFAAFIILPGIILFLLVTKRLLPLLKLREFWLATSLAIVFAASWLVIVSVWGKNPADNHYHNSGTVETMLFNDVYERLATTTFDYKKEYTPDRTFFVTTLDAHFNLWNYVWWLGLATGATILYKRRRYLSSSKSAEPLRLLLLSICLITPMALLLTFATFKHFWYLAPVYGYIAYVCAWTIMYYSHKWKQVMYIACALGAFTLARHVLHLQQRSTDMHRFMDPHNSYFKDHEQIVVVGPVQQHMLLYIKWLGKKVINTENELRPSDSLVLLRETSSSPNISQLQPVARYKDFSIAYYLPKKPN